MKPDLLVFSLFCAIAAAVFFIPIPIMKRILASKGEHANDSCFMKDYGIPMCSGFSILCLMFAVMTLYLGLDFRM